MGQKTKFVEGERVLCFHGPLIYEAKALKYTISKDKQVKYYIHYAGWNKNWDEWVPENRVLKYNEANVQRQNEVFKQHNAAGGRHKKGTPKGKKGEAGGGTTPKDGALSSESRASTPSKELNSSIATGATASADKLNTSSSTPGAATPAGATGRTSSRSKQVATPVTDAAQKKEDESGLSSKEDKDEPPKKKRGGSSSSIDKSTTGAAVTAAGTASAGANAATPTTPTPSANAATMATLQSTGSRLDAYVESEETFLSKVEVKIKIPDELKQCLADDWDAVTRQHKLLDVPAKITVQDIADQYLAHKKTAKSNTAAKEAAVSDVLNGIIEYFNVMLGSQLLYKFERPQYAEILQQHADTPLSKLYGAFHLLRLFVKLGSMLAFSALDEKGMQTLLIHLNDFLKFLVKNSATYFSMSSFVNASPEYHRNTQ